mmetsp:Transcript_21920/g.37807  ORF Transcript_21920/g.37807 Transcript_21920/m.37807 type:complete len:273 (+) Transcript_21920:159-977(+)
MFKEYANSTSFQEHETWSQLIPNDHNLNSLLKRSLNSPLQVSSSNRKVLILGVRLHPANHFAHHNHQLARRINLGQTAAEILRLDLLEQILECLSRHIAVIPSRSHHLCGLEPLLGQIRKHVARPYHVAHKVAVESRFLEHLVRVQIKRQAGVRKEEMQTAHVEKLIAAHFASECFDRTRVDCGIEQNDLIKTIAKNGHVFIAQHIDERSQQIHLLVCTHTNIHHVDIFHQLAGREELIQHPGQLRSIRKNTNPIKQLFGTFLGNFLSCHRI